MHKTEKLKKAISVQTNDLCVKFDDFYALHKISLDIQPGELFTLLGPSGCGKSTLLRAIAGLNNVSSGKIMFDGQDISKIPPWLRNIGFVFQNYALWPTKTIYENVAFGLKIRKVSQAELGERVFNALTLVELEHAAQKYPSQLSGGMQQRAALARALVIDPPVLLLDEPLSNLDAKLRLSLRRDIRKIQKTLGLTAIYVTHDQEEALDISDRIAVFRDGKVEQVDTPQALYEHPNSAFIGSFVGKATFIKGKITNDRAFELPNGTTLSVSFHDNSVKPGTAVLSFARPENIDFTEIGAGTIDGEVVDISYLGNIYRYMLRLQDGQEVEAESRSRLELSQRVGLRLPKMRLFPEDWIDKRSV